MTESGHLEDIDYGSGCTLPSNILEEVCYSGDSFVQFCLVITKVKCALIQCHLAFLNVLNRLFLLVHL